MSEDDSLFSDDDRDDEDALSEDLTHKHQHPFTGTVTGFRDAFERTASLRRTELDRHVENYNREINELQMRLQELNKERHNLQQQVNSLSDKSDGLDVEIEALYAQFESDKKNMRVQQQLAKLQEQQRRVDAELDRTDAEMQQIIAQCRELSRQIEQSRAQQADLLIAQEDMKADERRAVKEQQILAKLRVAKEQSMAAAQVQLQQSRAAATKKRQVEEAEKERKQAETAQEGLNKVRTLLNTRLKKEQEEADEKRKVEDAKQQRKAAGVLALKKEIETVATKDTRLAAERAKLEAARKQAEELEKQEILAHMGNPEVVLRKREMEKAEQKAKTELEQKKQRREQEIADKLAREARRAQALAASSTAATSSARAKSKPAGSTTASSKNASTNIGVAVHSEGAISATQPVTSRLQTKFLPNADDDASDTHVIASQSKPFKTIRPESLENNLGLEDLGLHFSEANCASADSDDDEQFGSAFSALQPEFDGLWEEEAGGGQRTKKWNPLVDLVPKGDGDMEGENELSDTATKKFNLTTKPLSKLEQAKMAEALTRQRDNIAQKQVVAGRQFNGPPFSCRPATVIFKDFEVGKTYQKRLILTNISYSFNSFHLVESPSKAIEYVYTPSGPLSPGLSTELTVIFTPRVNEDYFSEITLFAQTGAFTIPLQCLTKKFSVSASQTSLDFGVICRGETSTKQITISNDGALSSRWILRLAPTTRASSASTTVTSSDVNESMSATAENAPESDAPVPTNAEPAGVPDTRFLVADANSNSDSPISLTSAVEGTLDAHSSITLDFKFSPTVVGPAQSTYELVFLDETLPALVLQANGECSDLQVQLQQSVINFLTCQFDRQYSETFAVVNNSPSAVKLQFEMPSAAAKFFEISPKNAFVQPSKTFAATLRFAPRAEMFDECSKLFQNSDSGILNFMVTVRVSGQTLPLNLAIIAHVTPSAIELDKTKLDFGFVSVFESAVASVKLTNTSALPQPFAFIDIPEYCSIQPDDGFGVLLPFESLTYDIIFNPRKPLDGDYDRDFRFAVTCRWGVNGSQKVQCTGTAVVPKLSLSTRHVQFPVTAYGDHSVASIMLTNTSSNTQQFKFNIPADIPITISPLGGELPPNSSQRLRVCFQPSYQLAFGQSEDEKSAQDAKAHPHDEQNADTGVNSSGVAAIDALQKAMSRYFNSHIPCVSRIKSESGNDAALRERDVIYLNIEGAAVAPSIAVCEGAEARLNPTVKFGQVPIGRTQKRQFTIRNISKEDVVELSSSALDTSGPYMVVQAWRSLQPGQEQHLTIRFEPVHPGIYYEILEVKTKYSTVRIKVHGEGIKPSLVVTPENEINFSDCMVGSVVSSKLLLKNTSPFPIVFNLALADSNNSAEFAAQIAKSSVQSALHTDAAGAITDVAVDPLSLLPVVSRGGSLGSINFNGLSAFSITPASATIQPQKECEVVVTFSPDHVSHHYSTFARITISDEVEDVFVRFRGRAHAKVAFILGLDDIGIPHNDDALFISPQVAPSDSRQYLVFKHSLANANQHSSRTIKLGNASTGERKKAQPNAEYTLELSGVTDNSFALSATKVSVEVGSTKDVVIHTHPSKVNSMPGKTYEGTLRISCKADGGATSYAVVLKAYVSK